ncbi:MAG: thiosulfohydrolase SoxB [Gammaproteobacteria bacterium]|nr:thiosulfohydrolase SoxB [Gammaproteobacteria bacterium]
MNRREFIQFLLAGYASGIIKPSFASDEVNYKVPAYGNLRLLHITDTHAQLDPMYFREPDYNIGVGANKNKPPHIVGKKLLDIYSISSDFYKYAYSHLDFNYLAREFGKFGGYAYLKSVIDNLRADVNNSLLLDGGDTWQGSGLSLIENGADMVEASNMLGVDIMTGHWEFTFGESIFTKNIKNFNGDFIAQNIKLTEEAIFNGLEPIDENDHYVKPYVIKKFGNHNIVVIGQAFPYTPIANPKRMIPNLTFGIREAELQELIEKIKEEVDPSLIVLLSHNGVDVDKKMAEKVKGLDIILGGHTHDVLPRPIEVYNNNSRTIIINSGCNGKFISLLDLRFNKNSFEYNYKLLPIISHRINPSMDMSNFIDAIKKPHKKHLDEIVGQTNIDLYRRGNFNGTFDDLLCESMQNMLDSEICLSPGFRWGPTILAGENIKMSDIYSHTAITYPNVYRREMTGETIKNILEDVADNLFNPDPYFQQGGDMVRTRGLSYNISPSQSQYNRISNIRDSNDKLLKNNKKYIVSGWASVNSVESGKPIWDITKEYLTNIKQYNPQSKKTIEIIGESDNFGIET